jgi:hypothetical protein
LSFEIDITFLQICSRTSGGKTINIFTGELSNEERKRVLNPVSSGYKRGHDPISHKMTDHQFDLDVIHVILEDDVGKHILISEFKTPHLKHFDWLFSESM